MEDIESKGVDEPSTSPPDADGLINWNGENDPEKPLNWSNFRKWCIVCSSAIITFGVTFASSVFSTADNVTAKKFGVSSEVMVLGTSLFVLGFAFGPILWGPFSELYGRRNPLLVGYFAFAVFQIPVAVAQNLETIFLCRFFGGFFGSAPLAIIGGLFADLFEPINRGIAVACFASATFIGPVAGPIAGGFIVQSYLGWRWTEYITMIMGFAFFALAVFTIPETSAPILLQRRAKKMRFRTKNWAIHSKHDEKEVDIKAIVQTYLLRPFKMLASEPILLLITLYMSFIYGFLYLSFEAFPIAFQEIRGWNQGVGQLPFLAITVGVLIGALIIIWSTKTRYRRIAELEGHIVPEERLPPMILGGLLMPIGLFWFAWTSSPHITWVPQVLSGIFIGCGILLIFLQGLNYMIDCYAQNSNSAIAGNTLIRSLLGAAFPLFASYMFDRLGINWGMSLLGFLTALLFPVPVLFYIYGARIRGLSKFAPTNKGP